MPSYLSAFMSHAHIDNALCDGYHRALTQRGVACYYDRANPQTGHSLSVALQTEIERAQALIVMVSPAMLSSFWVEQEIDMFLALMAEERTRKLIPIKIAACEMPTRLRARWWLDATREPLDAVMDQLTRALEIATSSGPAASGARAGGSSRVVDWRRGLGDHTTIVEAIAAALPGERILVRKGLYEGGLTIDKPLELIGDGQPGDVEVHASGANVIKFTASQGRVANLTLRQTGGDWYGIDIITGRLELEDCDISSQGSACVSIHGSAHPILRRNRIHDGRQSGVFIYDRGQALLEDNDIFAHGLSGVEIKSGAAPTLRRNRIHDGKENGVMVWEQGQGLLEDNDIFANTLSGVEIKTAGSAPTLRRNRIHDGKQNGILVQEQGQGLLDGNDIFANANVGVEIRTGGAPTLRGNSIYTSVFYAIWAHDQGGGVFEENDLRNNTQGPWLIDDSSKAKVTRRGNVE